MTVAGAEHVDWEDIAIRGRTLYIGDIGDNLAQRPEIAVYRMPETSTVAEKITLRYPDGPHDAEALLVDPRDGTIVIVTKNFSGPAGVYVGRGAAPRGHVEGPGPDHRRRRLRRRPHDRAAQLRQGVRLDAARKRVARARL